MKIKYWAISLAAMSLIAASCNKQAVVQNNNMKNDASVMQGKNSGEVMKKEESAMMPDDKILAILFRDNQALTVWPGNELAMLDHDVTLDSNVKITAKGMVTLSNGTGIQLKNGQQVDRKGNISFASKELMATKAMMGEKNEMAKDSGTMMPKTDAMMAKHGEYLDYSADTLATAQKNGNKVVLFFHAIWCSFCKAADAAFQANLNKIPAGVTVLKTDYDSQTELKTKYGITYQHTFVQIDNGGNMVTKWVSGDVDLLAKNIK